MRKFTRYPQSMIFAAAIGTLEFDAMMDKYYLYSRHAVIHTDSPVACAYAEEQEMKYVTNLDDDGLTTL